MKHDRSGAQQLDELLLGSPIPAGLADRLLTWRAGAGAGYDGGVHGHVVRFVPDRWQEIDPWPARLGERDSVEPRPLSRGDVFAVAREGEPGERWAEVLAAAYIWGQGDDGHGAHRLHEILRRPELSRALVAAVADLREHGPVEAYIALHGAVLGLGPAVFTKFLYFVGPAVGARVRPLILDKPVACRVRALATALAVRGALPDPEALAAWQWYDTDWSPRRYGIYLRWLSQVAEQLGPTWTPELVQLALVQP